MGTITYLKDRFRRAAQHPRDPVTVNAYGFSVGATFVPWQSVSEIRVWKADLITMDEAFLAFSVGGQCITIGEEHAGFEALASAMTAVFPATAGWRDAVLLPAFARNEALLFTRGDP